MIIEVTVRLNPDGTFAAGHARDEKGIPSPIDVAALPALFKPLNAAALIKVDALRAEREALKLERDALKSAHDDMRQQLKPERERQREAKRAALAALQADLAGMGEG